MNICIFGAASSKIDSKYMEAGYELGAALAEAGHKLVFGGGNEGMMGAAAKGMRSKDGYVIGIIPEFFKSGDWEKLYDDCNEVIYTSGLSDRIELMKEMSDAFIITPGGLGTYHELFDVYTNRSLGRHNKLLIIYNINGYFDNLIKVLEQTAEENFMEKNRLDLIKVFDEAQLEELKSFLS